MNNKDRRIELQRLRDLANAQWEAKSHELGTMWGAVRFLDEQIINTDKLITEEEIKKREAELAIAKENEAEEVTKWVDKEEEGARRKEDRYKNAADRDAKLIFGKPNGI